MKMLVKWNENLFFFVPQQDFIVVILIHLFISEVKLFAKNSHREIPFAIKWQTWLLE